MKKVGEIMKEMGFNPESSESTQKAFIKYLIRVANRNRLTPEPIIVDPLEKDQDEWQELKTHSRSYKPPQPEQLSFPFVEKKSNSEAG